MKGLLQDNFPELRSQWSPDNDRSFDEVTCGLGYRARWVCPQHGEWIVDICSRVSKRKGPPTKCPKCKRKTTKIENSLSTRFPEIAKEWDNDKNIESVKTVSYANNNKYSWICKNGHKWVAAVNDRTLKGNGCPKCSGRVVTPETSLVNRFPELLKEWDYEKNKNEPEDVTYGSGYKAFWKCVNGHSWKSAVCDRTSERHQNGCPNCNFIQTSKMELLIYSEVKYYYPDALHRHKIDKRECDIYIPSLKLGIEIDSGLWHLNKEEKDADKIGIFKNAGISIISIREEGLGLINSSTIVFPRKKYDVFRDISKPLFSLLCILINDSRLRDYSTKIVPVNREFYLELIKSYPLTQRGLVAKMIRHHQKGLDKQ